MNSSKYPISKLISITVCLLESLLLSSCAIHYLDADTGAEHTWGFGHIATKISGPKNGKQAIITENTLTGLAIGLEEGYLGFSAGWDQRNRVVLYDENTSISIQRPQHGSFFLIEFGSELPTQINNTSSK